MLEEILITLDAEDQKAFSHFLNRFRSRENRKDLELFKRLTSETVSSGKMSLDTSGKVAYYAARKRLLGHLLHFIHMKKSAGKPGSAEYIRNLLSLSEHLFEQKQEKSAWKLIQKAEGMALDLEDYKLLNQIYSLQIENCHSEFAPDLKEILIRKKKYQNLAREDDNAAIAYNLVKYELSQALVSGKDPDIENLIESVLGQYGLKDKMTERPRLLYNIIATLRTAALAKKDFYQFEPYLIRMCSQALHNNKFSRHSHIYKLGMLYMVGHVLYRNKKFAEAEQWLDQMEVAISEYEGCLYNQFYPRYILLRAAVLNYSGRNEMAVSLLEKAVTEKVIRMDNKQLLNTYLNLSIYYFQKGEFGKSIRIFRHVQHSDKWLTKVMGKEWVLKKDIIECINQFELGNADLVEARLTRITRSFADLFQRPLYQRVKTFLNLVKMLNNDPGISSGKEFHDLVETSFVFVEAEKEDIQAMTFFGWLKAKMEGRQYYQVLLELVARETEE